MRSINILRRILTALTALLLMLSVSFAAAEDILRLPAGLTTLGKDALLNDSSITSLMLPQALSSCDEDILSSLPSLRYVYAPDNIADISALRLLQDGTRPVLLRTGSASAIAWARENGRDYQAGTFGADGSFTVSTAYRALIIGNTYPNDETPLKAPANDVTAMKKTLSQFSQTPFRVTAKTNLTRQGILSAVSQTFAGATKNDVSLFYYSGHGTNNGALVGTDMPLSITDLRSALDAVPGRKIVILDYCFSGKFISLLDSKGISEADAVRQANSAVISAFSGGLDAKGGTGTEANPYYVITASAADEKNYSYPVGEGAYFSAFTVGLCRTAGYDPRSGSFTGIAGDGVFTLNELYSGAENALRNDSQYATIRNNQHAQCTPTNNDGNVRIMV